MYSPWRTAEVLIGETQWTLGLCHGFTWTLEWVVVWLVESAWSNSITLIVCLDLERSRLFCPIRDLASLMDCKRWTQKISKRPIGSRPRTLKLILSLFPDVCAARQLAVSTQVKIHRATFGDMLGNIAHLRRGMLPGTHTLKHCCFFGLRIQKHVRNSVQRKTIYEWLSSK